MATVSWMVFKHHKKADGTYNPKIRISHKRTTVYMATQIFTPFVRFKRGQTSGLITDGEIEDSLNDKVKDIRKVINTYDYIIEECENAQSVLTFINRKMNENKDLNFLSFAEAYIKNLKDNDSKRSDLSLLANLRYYTNTGNLPVKRITSSFLVRFETWLRTSRSITVKGSKRQRPPLKNSSIQTYMQTMQAIYNRMLLQYNDYELGDIIIPGDPFKKYTASEISVPFTLWLCGINSASSAPYITGNYIYYCKIWENGELLRDFIPMSNGKTEAFYDQVTKTLFYKQSGPKTLDTDGEGEGGVE